MNNKVITQKELKDIADTTVREVYETHGGDAGASLNKIASDTGVRVYRSQAAKSLGYNVLHIKRDATSSIMLTSIEFKLREVAKEHGFTFEFDSVVSTLENAFAVFSSYNETTAEVEASEANLGSEVKYATPQGIMRGFIKDCYGDLTQMKNQGSRIRQTKATQGVSGNAYELSVDNENTLIELVDKFANHLFASERAIAFGKTTLQILSWETGSVSTEGVATEKVTVGKWTKVLVELV